MKIMTIKDLYNQCERQMLKGNADKMIYTACDEEGNYYNPLWYGINDGITDIKLLKECGCIDGNINPENVVVMG